MKHIKCADVDNCGIVRLCFAVFVAIGAAIPLTAVAAATAAPSSLYDLTTSDAGSVSSTSSQYNKSYSGAKAFDGLKTGYIDAGGSSVVITATRAGKRAVAVVLGSSSAKERDEQAARLITDALGALAW